MNENRHIIICCDGSMRTYFKAIHSVLPQIITMLLPIYGDNIKLHIAVYHDYDTKSPRHERGGYIISYDGTVESCRKFVDDNCTKVAGGGGDGPEAALTAFVYMYDFISDLDGNVMIIHCTDQAPHGFCGKRVNNRIISEYRVLFGIQNNIVLQYLSKKIFEMAQEQFDIDRTEPQTWNLFTPDGREIINTENVVYQIKKMQKSSKEETCSLCYIDAHSKDMIFSCGGCNNRICLDCNKEWYGKSKLGGLICKSYLECPFCKKAPSFKIWTRAGKYLRTLRKSTLHQWNNAYWYGWCRTCNGIKQAMPKECAGGGMPNLDEFQCEDCHNDFVINSAVDYLGDTVECPGCGMDTEKDFGCDHMTCICGQHFCFQCGEGFCDAETTYNHMYSTH